MSHSLDDLLYLMARLRDSEYGCPWDLKQTMHSILPSTIEEVYELVDAIESDDVGQIREELGDVLFQVVFYARLAEEKGWFDFSLIVSGLTEKLLHRHPHVFPHGDLHALPDHNAASMEQVHQQWEAIKAEERQHKQQYGLLADIPDALPSLKRAQKIQKRVSAIGFDWPDAPAALEKISEELEELQQALVQGDAAACEEELGDLLFSCVNVARHLKIDAELALVRANKKFERRFGQLEQQLQLQGRTPENTSLLEMDELWQKAKQAE